ncbi:hypothetical protein BSKO_04002 [Bryopsis sp. KO-2023]|nr:hypothetical protein BSKO_04002 [Bryopsis sp. KO-2023]
MTQDTPTETETPADVSSAGPTKNALEEPSPCPILSKLYDSHRPAVELVPGVPLAPIVAACWPKGSAKKMMEESWIPTEPEDGGEEKKQSFNPKDTAYMELPQRLSRSNTMQEWNSLKIKEIALTTDEPLDDAQKESRATELEQVKSRISELEGGLSELKASIESDPTSLVSWMKTFFDLADAGLSSWDVGGAFWPHCPLSSLFGGLDAGSLHEGIEKLLGAFKKRYELERGANKIQIFTKFVPNVFREDYVVEHVEQAIDKMRENLQVEIVDMVQVYWWDFEGHDPVPTLRALQKLKEDKVEVDPDSGAQTVTAPKKIKAIGLVDFPARAIKDAIHAGVDATSVALSYNLFDRSAREELEICRDYGVKVFAKGACLGGLVSEKYIGVGQPDENCEDLDCMATCRDLVVKIGGWEKLQSHLEVIRNVAAKHGVTFQTVALRWQMDQGTFPLCTMGWAPHQWKSFGYLPGDDKVPGLDHQLFHKASFLDEQDMIALELLAK